LDKVLFIKLYFENYPGNVYINQLILNK
jgi:hypothetical protein